MGVTELAPYAGLLAAIASLGGLVFAALRFQRTDAGEVVVQQTQVFDNAIRFANELQEQLSDCRAARREVEANLVAARRQLEESDEDRRRLRDEVRGLERRKQDLTAHIESLQRELAEFKGLPDG